MTRQVCLLGVGLNIAPKGNIAPNQRNIAPATETASVK